MEADLQHWQAIEEEARNPDDFLIPDPNYRDVLRGLLNYVIAATRHRVLGGVGSPWTLRQEIGYANTARQLGPERIRECEEWLAEDLVEDDPFEGVDCYNA
jgi:hypothetical protein